VPPSRGLGEIERGRHACRLKTERPPAGRSHGARAHAIAAHAAARSRQPLPAAHAARAGRRHALPLDDRAAGDDDLLLAHPLQPDAAGEHGFIGLENYEFFVTDPSFGTAVLNTLYLIGSVIAITVVGGVGLALLIDAPFPAAAWCACCSSRRSSSCPR
jgi:hypothetical protein